jgi:RHS repeat-associated protein
VCLGAVFKRLLCALEKEIPAGWAYHLPDALGSVRQVADPAAIVALARAYEPFGSRMLTAGPAASPYGFGGEWRDATELMYLRARYYDPRVGRFVTADPFSGLPGMPWTLHPYAYAHNNPILLVDPSGEFVFIPLLLVAAAGGLLGGIGYYALQPAVGAFASGDGTMGRGSTPPGRMWSTRWRPRRRPQPRGARANSPIPKRSR